MQTIANLITQNAIPIVLMLVVVLFSIAARYVYLSTTNTTYKQRTKYKEQFDVFCIGFVKDLTNCKYYNDLLLLKIEIDAFSTNYMGIVDETYRFDSLKHIYTLYHKKLNELKPKVLAHR